MPDKIVLGSITLYAKVVVLEGEGHKEVPVFSVSRYSTPEGTCLFPFKGSSKFKDDLYVRPEDPNASFPPVEGVEADGECDVRNPFLKYYFKERDTMWVAVNHKNEPLTGLRGRLSEMFRIPIG